MATSKVAVFILLHRLCISKREMTSFCDVRCTLKVLLETRGQVHT